MHCLWHTMHFLAISGRRHPQPSHFAVRHDSASRGHAPWYDKATQLPGRKSVITNTQKPQPNPCRRVSPVPRPLQNGNAFVWYPLRILMKPCLVACRADFNACRGRQDSMDSHSDRGRKQDSFSSNRLAGLNKSLDSEPFTRIFTEW